MLFQNEPYHFRCGLSRVCIVAIDQDIGIGIDFPEHPAHHVALALLVFVANDCAGFFGKSGCAIGRIIIVDINSSRWQRILEVFYYFFDGFGFVIARYQN